MVRHIVMWKLKESARGRTKAQNAAFIKERLESLKEKIPEIIKIEVGFDFSRTENSADVILYSEFRSKEALDAYQANPEHLACKPLISEICSERRLGDYEA